MVDTEMTATPTQQPEALRLADVLEKMPGYDWNKTYCEAAFQLRHIQHQNECLTAEIEKQRTARIEAQTENEELKAAVSDAVAAEREACEERVEDLYEKIETPYLVYIVRAIYACDKA